MNEIRPVPGYTVIDHTADLGILVTAQSLQKLFEHAALALADLITGAGAYRGTPDEILFVDVQGEDLEDLMVNWLREVLYLFNGKEQIMTQAMIRKISTRSLSARLSCRRFHPGKEAPALEIKAVTYHGLQVKKKKGLWETAVIFDV